MSFEMFLQDLNQFLKKYGLAVSKLPQEEPEKTESEFAERPAPSPTPPPKNAVDRQRKRDRLAALINRGRS